MPFFPGKQATFGRFGRFGRFCARDMHLHQKQRCRTLKMSCSACIFQEPVYSAEKRPKRPKLPNKGIFPGFWQNFFWPIFSDRAQKRPRKSSISSRRLCGFFENEYGTPSDPSNAVAAFLHRRRTQPPAGEEPLSSLPMPMQGARATSIASGAAAVVHGRPSLMLETPVSPLLTHCDSLRISCGVNKVFKTSGMQSLALHAAFWTAQSRGQVHTTPVSSSALQSICGVNLSIPGLGKSPGQCIPGLDQSRVRVSPDREHHPVRFTPDRDHHAVGSSQPQLAPALRRLFAVSLPRTGRSGPRVCLYPVPTWPEFDGTTKHPGYASTAAAGDNADCDSGLTLSWFASEPRLP
jgi:hypothetical protein